MTKKLNLKRQETHLWASDVAHTLSSADYLNIVNFLLVCAIL